MMLCVSIQYAAGGIWSTPSATIMPPKIPTQLAYSASNGIIKPSATMRGSTKKSTGEIPSAASASISSLAFMLPSVAANAAPVRPANTIAAIIGPISRTTDRPTKSAT